VLAPVLKIYDLYGYIIGCKNVNVQNSEHWFESTSWSPVMRYWLAMQFKQTKVCMKTKH
jgi:hypothetical protein